MYYSDELIEEVRSRNPIQDVVGSYVHLTKKGGNYFGLCPFHNEKTGSFSVSPSKQIYHCFGCGAGGNVITFIMNYENASFQEAMEILAARAGIELPKQEYTPKQKQEADLKTQLLEIHKEAAIYYHKILRSEQGKQGLKYFRSRGLSDPTMVSFGLGYTGQHSDGLYRFMKEKGYSDLVLKETGLFTINEKGGRDKFWNRVMFPIMDSGNRVIGFGGRLMGQGEPKYLNSPETKIFEKGKNLYALNVAKRSKEPYFLIMEGYMDVISVHQAGFPNAVAALGTAFTPRHAAIIKRYKEEAVLCFDMDDAGRKAALRAIPILRAEGLRLKVISLVPYKDPDEFIQNLGTDEFRKRIETAENAFLFEVRMEREKFDFADPAEKTLFFNRAAKMLAAFREEIERNSYIEAVSKQYGIDYGVLKKRVEEIGNRALNENPDEYAPETKRAVKPAGKDKETGLKEAEKLVLTELVDRPERFQEIREKLSPEDFRPGVARSVATLLFEQLSRGRDALNPEALLDWSLKGDAYNEVAAFFTSTYSERLSQEERDRALSEAIKKLRLEALEEKIRETTEPQTLMDLLKQKDALR